MPVALSRTSFAVFEIELKVGRWGVWDKPELRRNFNGDFDRGSGQIFQKGFSSSSAESSKRGSPEVAKKSEIHVEFLTSLRGLCGDFQGIRNPVSFFCQW